MIGVARQNGLWAQAFTLSVLLHGGFMFYVAAPMLHFNALQLPPAEPMAVTLSIMDMAPETIEPSFADPAPEPLPLPESLPEAVAEPIPEVPVEEVAPLAAEEPEQLASLAAEEPEPLNSVEPEQAEPLATPEPETLAPVEAAEPEAVAPVEPAAAEPIAPVATSEISPLLPDEDTLAALAPLGSAEVIGTAAAATIAEPIAPVQSLPTPEPPGTPSTIAVAPQAPEGTPGVPGPVDEFILRIRGQLALPCLVATPRRGQDGAVSLEMLAANEADILTFADDLLAGVSPAPARDAVLVDPRQCAALNFVREGARYPAYPLALGLESDNLVSGDRLKGSLRNAAGRYVTLVLIDDNGVVQDLGGYLTFSGDTVSFDVPVRRDGPVRDTQQLLLAIATPGRPPELEAMNGRLAQDFFAAIRQSVARDAPLAMMPFRLQ